MSKRAGRHSQSANDFLQPMAPVIDSATDVGTSRAFNDGAVTVSFTLPEGSPAATGYTVLSSGSHTATGSSSPITVTGLSSDTAYTFQVKATNAIGDSDYSTASSSVTATTVPNTPAAPSAVTVNNAAQDTVSWTAPSNGGKAISNYDWESDDSKSGSTSSTSVTLGQEAGTSQSYRVRAQNANGYSNWSQYSSSVTTFSFTPFSFVPYSFTPFSFAPYSFTPTFSFTPFSFAPYSFTPTFSFTPTQYCIDEDTLIQVVGLSEKYGNESVELKAAKDIKVGDSVWSISWDGLKDDLTDPETSTVYPEELSNVQKVKTEIVSISPSKKEVTLYLNGDMGKRFSAEEKILVKRDNQHMFIQAKSITTLDEIFEATDSGMIAVPVTSIDYIEEEREVFTFNAFPTDTLIAGNIIVHNKKF